MIEKFEDTPFEKKNQTVIDEDNYYKVYEDKWPVCDGHLLFVPKENNTKFITITLQATVQYGEKLVEEGKIDGVRESLPELLSKYPRDPGVLFLKALFVFFFLFS